jgi:peptidoglycan/LPS O-acetylase OafA/YrhL
MSSPPAVTAAPRSLGIDFLRAICILYVVGYWHLIPYTTALPGYANWLTEGFKYVALATFVFCSGLLLARQEVGLSPRALWSFYRSRLLRIYPLYLLSLVLFGVFGIASLEQVVEGALLLSMLTPSAMPTLWFVTMIMLFYLLAPWLIRCADQLPSALLAGSVLLTLLIVVHLWLRPIDLRLLVYLPVFMLGILYRRQRGLAGLVARWRWPLAVLLGLMLPLSRVGNEWSVLGALTLVPLAGAGALVMIAFSESIARRVHGSSIRFLAYASFGLYLAHRLVFKGVIAIYFPVDGWVQVGYLLLSALPLSMLLGYCAQRIYDHFLDVWGQRGA